MVAAMLVHVVATVQNGRRTDVSLLRGEPVETLQRLRMSYGEYDALPESVRAEWVDGEVVVSPTASFDHQGISWELALRLRTSLPSLWVREAVSVHLSNNRERIPDVIAVTRRPTTRYVSEPPVIAIEILSPSTRAEDTIRKSREYAEGGVGQYWIVDPELRRIDVLTNADGEWDLLLHLDDGTPAGEVVVGEYGAVPLDLSVLDADQLR